MSDDFAVPGDEGYRDELERRPNWDVWGRSMRSIFYHSLKGKPD